MATEAIRRAVAKYDAENTVKIGIKLNRKTDGDIIAALEDSEDGKQPFIKRAIRSYIAGGNSDLPVVAAPDKWLFVYGMRQRGFSPMAQPMEGLVGTVNRISADFAGYHDILLYNRPLSADEVRDFELDEL